MNKPVQSKRDAIQHDVQNTDKNINFRACHSLRASLRNQNKCSLISVLVGKELAILRGTKKRCMADSSDKMMGSRRRCRPTFDINQKHFARMGYRRRYQDSIAVQE
ncbi:hypothetical protein AVEN_142666-1 [Araneus ventricosus]|uniref:Uncharacterized protein n=1 Tax=Araneus ventricosus TaxID=182803 RepID=A0A4Y2TC40_ARAVE|nr:hypothetical protein AVEN_142666-1 [Araneus ventricosus]